MVYAEPTWPARHMDFATLVSQGLPGRAAGNETGRGSMVMGEEFWSVSLILPPVMLLSSEWAAFHPLPAFIPGWPDNRLLLDPSVSCTGATQPGADACFREGGPRTVTETIGPLVGGGHRG